MCKVYSDDVKNVYELHPMDGRKSFYGKAIVYEMKNCSRILYSYGVPVLRIDVNDKLHRLWDSWSLTTGRHVYAFTSGKITKKEWDKMPVESE